MKYIKGKPRKTRGKLITFEGVEGSGKSTHARLLAEAMRSAGHRIVEVREPGGTRLGEAIRLLLSRHDSPEALCSQAELLLFLASRAQLVHHVIIPALKRGEHVVCDRFLDSTAAYQGYARGCDLALITRMNAFATQDILPDLTILLDLDPSHGLRRLCRRNRKQKTEKDRIERESIAFHKLVRQGYLSLARRTPKRFCVVAAARPVAVVNGAIWKAVRNVIG